MNAGLLAVRKEGMIKLTCFGRVVNVQRTSFLDEHNQSTPKHEEQSSTLCTSISTTFWHLSGEAGGSTRRTYILKHQPITEQEASARRECEELDDILTVEGMTKSRHGEEGRMVCGRDVWMEGSND